MAEVAAAASCPVEAPSQHKAACNHHKGTCYPEYRNEGKVDDIDTEYYSNDVKYKSSQQSRFDNIEDFLTSVREAVGFVETE